MAWDESSGAKIIPNCILWMRGLVPFWVLRHSFLFIKTASDCITSSWRIAGGTLSAPFWCLCQKLSLSPLYFNKTLLHKSAERSSLVSGPGLNSSPPEAKNPTSYKFSNNLSILPRSTGGSVSKESACNVADPGSVSGWGGSPGEGNDNALQYSSWEILRTEKPRGLRSVGSQRVGHNWMTKPPQIHYISVLHLFAIVQQIYIKDKTHFMSEFFILLNFNSF